MADDGRSPRPVGGAGQVPAPRQPRGALPGAPWYREGLRFECTMCGNCCTGPEGVVWFDREEGRAMAAAVGIAEGDFYQRFARRIGNRWSLSERVVERGGQAMHDCIFLDRESAPGRGLCKVYEARPTQCRTWPFWRENLTSRRAWEAAKRRAPCPGMDAGPLVPLHEITVRRDALPDDH